MSGARVSFGTQSYVSVSRILTFNQSMNSYRRGLRNGVLVNPKLFILEKVNFGPHIKC